ncbi:Staphylococcal nuclease domain-containing protein [Zalerion maritima]|uniref:Probable endonuclease LCL3 n=1 Tax=Zalerion maritima TaxID=339359 RepID=A0AAD5WTC4_9PEZI|nr:Staphylococcal nuclease domain-containing protein [Zalerion maritima]
MASPTTYMASFKSALSGDTIVCTPPTNLSGPERVLNFAWISAPHMKKEGDEEFAFQARDYLRRLCVGQQLRITNQYTIPNTSRQYVTADLRDGTKFPEVIVHAGWAKVREEAGKKEEDELILDRLDKLRFYESEAKDEAKGLWGAASGFIDVEHEIIDADAFLKEWKGKTVPGRVERVITGDRLLVRLILTEKKHMQLMTLLAGIRAPATERNVGGQAQPGEEFGSEAKAYVESRLLQKEVNVLIVGVSPQRQLVATVKHPAKGNIAEFLLSDGLARCNDFHSTLLGDKMSTLRSCERKAQSEKLKLHKNHVAKEASGNFDMTVLKVISADTIIVRNKAGSEKRINFSSCRGPRTTDQAEVPFRDEAKEYLRKKLIGKHVSVAIDGRKPAADGFEAREVATVAEKGKNVGLQLVQDGWCSVIRHKKDDTDRASNYDELLAAQESAQEAKKGMWSGKPNKAKQYTDYSTSVKDATRMLQTLKRQKKIPAVIDFCKSGSRFTILIPRENAKITMVLAGIRAPRAPRNTGEGGDPFGQESIDFANRRCNQRDCEVDILDIDKVGGFIGNLYMGRENFAKALVEEGLASVHAYSAEKTGNSDLISAEKKAKQARKGMWQDWEPSQDEDAEEAEPEPTAAEADSAASMTQRPKDYRSIFITHVDESGRLKIQEIGKGTSALETMMTDFRKAQTDPKNNNPYKDAPKAGEYVAAKFSLDGCWYRARVRSNDRSAKKSEVLYIDYGNTEKLPWTSMRPLDLGKYGVQVLRSQASDALLSFTQMPTQPDYLADAVAFMLDCTAEHRLIANFDYVDSKENISYITVFDSESSTPSPTESLNRDVVANGHAMVPRKLKPWERSKAFEPVFKNLKESESKAKVDRLGMWEYGDLTED